MEDILDRYISESEEKLKEKDEIIQESENERLKIKEDLIKAEEAEKKQDNRIKLSGYFRS